VSKSTKLDALTLEWVDAADEEEHDYSGTDPRLASRFDEIDAIRRNLTCA